MRMSRRLFLVASLLAGLLPAMTDESAAQNAEQRTASGLRFIEIREGNGAQPLRGQTAVVHYTGWLFENGQRGRKFDSSKDRNEPFEFPLGMGRVIKGWDEGVRYMKVGGKRWIIVPPYLGYGNQGMGRIIPAGSTLMFEIELMAVR